MKIGFIVSFFDFRNDVRRIITEAAREHHVIVFGLERDRESIMTHLPQAVDFRIIEEGESRLSNRIWKRLYLYLRKIPKSENNFFLMELFKASNAPGENRRKKALRILQWVKWLPKVMSYDFFLNRSSYSSGTDISDIDQFICFTDINNDCFFKRLLDSSKPAKVYVYSWDHPCKHTRFSKRATYLVWNTALKQDLIELQGIPAEQIQVLGASQFTYIDDYQKKPEEELNRHYHYPYVYFGCALGIEELVPGELEVVKKISSALKEIRPGWKLVVRPYPVLQNWSYYEELESLDNIILDDGFRRKDRSIGDQAIFEKYEKIHFAEAFFHLGTTMGLEACFTPTPSFLVDMAADNQQGLNLYNFVHQYQNDKHLAELAPQNVVKSEGDLHRIFEALGNEGYLVLNKQVQRQFQLKDTATLAKDLLSTP